MEILTIFFWFPEADSASSFPLFLFLVAAADGFLGFFSTFVTFLTFDGDDFDVDAAGVPLFEGAIATWAIVNSQQSALMAE